MIWKFIREKLEDNIKTVLMVVVDSKGSSPGKKGFKMAVCEDGTQSGSIGGGRMEYRLTDQAKLLIKDGRGVKLVRQVHNEDAEHGSGMICAGSQVVALVPIDKEELPQIKQIIKKGKGLLSIDRSGISFEEETKNKFDLVHSFKDGEDWVYREITGIENEIYIFGGGHVGLALSRLMKELDFRVRVFDHRQKSLKTIRDNVFAHEIQIIDYDEANEYVPDGENIYVAIMTSDHHLDGLILEQMIPKKIRYLGMLGSKKKVNRIFTILNKTGISTPDYEHVDSPMGIEIESNTPMEIAVSIAAKVILVKNGMRDEGRGTGDGG